MILIGGKISLGRIINGIGYLSLLIGAAQIGGLVNLLPPKLAAILIATGGTAAALSERLHAGVSDPVKRENARIAEITVS